MRFRKCFKMRKCKRVLIFVSGPVGVGKTTFSTILFRLMLSQGHGVCYRSLTAFPLFSYMFFKLLATLLYGLNVVRYHERVRIHPSTLFILRVKSIPKPITVLFMFLESLSMLLSLYYKVILSCMNRRVIIVDEGFLNMVANYIEVFGKRSAFLIALIAILLQKLQKRFKLSIIYLDAADTTLIERWRTRGYPAFTPIVDVMHHLMYVRLIRFSKKLLSNMTSLIELNTDEEQLLLNI